MAGNNRVVVLEILFTEYHRPRGAPRPGRSRPGRGDPQSRPAAARSPGHRRRLCRHGPGAGRVQAGADHPRHHADGRILAKWLAVPLLGLPIFCQANAHLAILFNGACLFAASKPVQETHSPAAGSNGQSAIAAVSALAAGTAFFALARFWAPCRAPALLPLCRRRRHLRSDPHRSRRLAGGRVLSPGLRPGAQAGKTAAAPVAGAAFPAAAAGRRFQRGLPGPDRPAHRGRVLSAGRDRGHEQGNHFHSE